MSDQLHSEPVQFTFPVPGAYAGCPSFSPVTATWSQGASWPHQRGPKLYRAGNCGVTGQGGDRSPASWLSSPCGRRLAGSVEASSPCSAQLSTDAICLYWLPGGRRASGQLLHTGCSLFSEEARLGSLSVWPCLSGLGQLEMFPLLGGVCALPRAHGTQGCVVTDLGQQEASPHSGLQTRPQAGQPRGDHSLGLRSGEVE